ncbi:transposable element Tcb1 transposase [Trichonephila clavipes]|nr:transposable element Tcb1 transposase [Trichonephila clavipes]
MTSRKRKEDSEPWRAVGRIESGQSITNVALLFGVHHSVISRLWKQFQTAQTAVQWPAGGCPRVTTPAEDRYIAIVAKRNHRASSTRVTSTVTASIGKAISTATVRRRLHMNVLYARVLPICVPPSIESRGARLKWCREHYNWTVSDWDNVMFTDESRFALEPDDKRKRKWRKQGTRKQPPKHHAFRFGSIMVAAGISLGYLTDLHIFKRGSVTAVRYRDEVPETIVRLYAAAVGPTFVLMDDNARPHRAAIVDDYLESKVNAHMAWPADFNLIENHCDALGRAVSSRFPPPATLIELETALQEESQIEAHEIHLGKGLEVRLSLALSTLQMTVRFSSAKIPEGTIDGDTTYLYLQNFCMELKGREIFSSPCARDSARKTSDPLIYRARTPCALGGYLVASDIEPRPSGLESDALTTRLPTVL